MIRRNYLRGESDDTAGAVRAGKGLLAGLLRCGRCGRQLYVRYWGKAGTSARYLCTGDFVAGGRRYCVGFGGATVDRRFGDEIVRVLSPLGIRASLDALDRLSAIQDERRHALAAPARASWSTRRRAPSSSTTRSTRAIGWSPPSSNGAGTPSSRSSQRARAQLTELDDRRPPVRRKNAER